MNNLAWTAAVAVLTAAFAASAAPGAPGAPGASGTGAASPTGTIIYEWVDDSGVRHASDTVPEKYKGVARQVDPSRFRIPAGEQQKAEQQAATLKAKAASPTPPYRPAGASAQPGATRAASLSGSPSAADTPECVAWRRQLAASRECFVGFSNPDGSSGFHSCSTEPDPKPACVQEGSR